MAENHSLLQEQQTTLAEHADRLDALTESQETLVYTLNQLRAQIDDMSTQMAKMAKGRDAQKIDEKAIKAKNLKLARPVAPPTNGKSVIGRVEYIFLNSARQYFKARIDTGARSSVIYARDVQRFERNGQPWVRFTLNMDEGGTITLESAVARETKVKNGSDNDRRYTVKQSLRLGEIAEEAEFSISERDDSVYPLLLGRNFLQDIAVVDVAKKFTRERDPKLIKP